MVPVQIVCGTKMNLWDLLTLGTPFESSPTRKDGASYISFGFGMRILRTFLPVFIVRLRHFHTRRIKNSSNKNDFPHHLIVFITSIYIKYIF